MNGLITDELDRALQNDAVLITVNRRLARACARAFNQRRIDENLKSWRTPVILSVDAWLNSLFNDLYASGLTDQHLLIDEQEKLIWKQVLDESTGNSTLLSVSATALSLAKSFRIEHAYSNEEDLDSEYLNEDQQHYRRWSRVYRQKCERAQAIDTARLADCLAAILHSGVELPVCLLPEQLITAGFSKLTPQLKRFLDSLQQQGVEVDLDYQPESIGRVFRRLACQDPADELANCARWARERYQESGDQHDIGIVIPDLQQRRSEVLRTFDAVFFPGATPLDIERSGRPYDVSLGKPLSQFAPISNALLILEMGFNQLTGNAISQFLLSPYLTEYNREKSARASLDTSLRESGVRTLNVDSLMSGRVLPTGLTTVLQRMGKATKQGRARPSVWLKRFIVMLDAVGWPGQPGKGGSGNGGMGSTEFQAIEAWRDSVDNLVKLDGLLGVVSVREMLSILNQMSGVRVFQPQSDDVPIQIMGTLESQGLRFDVLWITGMDNDAWPLRSRPSAFLPYQWQKRVAAPGGSHQHTLTEARDMVRSWKHNSRDVLFSFPASRSGNEVVASLQIADLETVAVADVIKQPSVDAAALLQASVAEHVEWVDDRNGPATTPGARIKGGARLFEDQASCPFRAFALHRLNIRTLEDPVLGIDVREKGNFFHHAMQFFWDTTGDHATLVSLPDETLLSRVREAIEDAMKDAWHESPQLLTIEQRRLEQIIISWLTDFEKPRDPFSVEMTEATHEFNFGSLGLRLQVDRVDLLTDGGRIIIDYKTGKGNSTTSWKEERMTSAQLPLYAILLKDVEAICFAQVAVNQNRFVGMASEKHLLQGLTGPANEANSWAQQLGTWREHLAMLAAEIRQGYAAVTPKKSACRYCRLPALCRVSNDTLQDSVDAEDETGSSRASS